MEAVRPQEEEVEEPQQVVAPAIPQPIDFSAFDLEPAQPQSIALDEVKNELDAVKIDEEVARQEKEKAQSNQIKNELDNLEKMIEENAVLEDELMAEMNDFDPAQEKKEEAVERIKEEIKILTMEEIQQIRAQYQVNYPKFSMKVAKVEVPALMKPVEQPKPVEEKKQEVSEEAQMMAAIALSLQDVKQQQTEIKGLSQAMADEGRQHKESVQQRDYAYSVWAPDVQPAALNESYLNSSQGSALAPQEEPEMAFDNQFALMQQEAGNQVIRQSVLARTRQLNAQLASMQGQLLQQMPVAEREAYKAAHMPARIAEAPAVQEQDKVVVKPQQQANALYKDIQVKMLANVIGQMQKQMVQAMQAAKIPAGTLAQQKEEDLKAQAEYYLGLTKYDYSQAIVCYKFDFKTQTRHYVSQVKDRKGRNRFQLDKEGKLKRNKKNKDCTIF